MRNALAVSLAVAVSFAAVTASADMPAYDCSTQDECSYCEPTFGVAGYCEGGECVEGDKDDCGGGCNTSGGGAGRLAPTMIVLGGVVAASAIAWRKRRSRR